MEKTQSRVQTMVVVSLLIALEIILTRFVSITTPFIRIGFGFLPIVIIAILYGPVWSSLAYAIGDIIGAFLFPSGAFFPGFTLSAFITGLIFGIILYKHEVTITRTLVACVIVLLGVNLIINTCWLSILMGKGYLAILPGRIIKEAICIPIYTILILAMDKTIIKKLRAM